MRIALTLILLALALWIILIFTTPPIQVCVGRADDSWVCTYTARDAYTEWAQAQARAAGY